MVYIKFVVINVLGILFVAVIFRSVVAQNVFQTSLQRMDLGKGCGVVHLEGVFRAMLVAFIVLVFQALEKIIPAIGSLHVKIIGV